MRNDVLHWVKVDGHTIHTIKSRNVTFICYILHGEGKGKVHRCTGTEALYRPYGQ